LTSTKPLRTFKLCLPSAVEYSTTPSDSEEIIGAIENQDVNYLTKFPGIGKKSAQQIILDLQNDYQSSLYEDNKVFEMVHNEVFEIVNFDEIEENRAIINNLTQEDYENGYSWIDENNIILLASSKCEDNELDFKEYAKDRRKELSIAIYTLISIFVIVSIVYGLFLLNLGSLSYIIVFGSIYLIGAFIAYIKIKEPIILKKKLKNGL